MSPPLAWRGQPEGTRGFAVICDDPDAPSGTFTHWVVYNIAPTATALAEGARGAGTDGVNSFGRAGYNGPCPPPGRAHHYRFHVYALDIESVGPAKMSAAQATAAMADHVLAEGLTSGTYAHAARHAPSGAAARRARQTHGR